METLQKGPRRGGEEDSARPPLPQGGRWSRSSLTWAESAPQERLSLLGTKMSQCMFHSFLGSLTNLSKLLYLSFSPEGHEANCSPLLTDALKQGAHFHQKLASEEGSCWGQAGRPPAGQGCRPGFSAFRLRTRDSQVSPEQTPTHQGLIETTLIFPSQQGGGISMEALGARPALRVPAGQRGWAEVSHSDSSCQHPQHLLGVSHRW